MNTRPRIDHEQIAREIEWCKTQPVRPASKAGIKIEQENTASKRKLVNALLTTLKQNEGEL